MAAPEMRYFSTRGGKETLSFEEAVLTGLAPNGGLYIPTHIPKLPADWQTAWASLSFTELSEQILSLFVPTDVIPREDLRDIIERSYATFRDAKVTPLRQTGEGEYVLELWHGPTWAFKDVALQFLGNLFAYFLARRNEGVKAQDREGLTVVGATSGDTGSAAIYGLRSKPDISIFILYPDGRISPIQLAQMATVSDENVHVVAVENSDFDTCQAIVKTLFSDKQFNATHRLGAINSINWARILAQIVYYFSAYFQLPADVRAAGSAQFVVPTGNFGDILAGWYAKKLGLPMRELVVATNENDILERFFRTGRYEAEDSDAAAAGTGVPETDAVGGSSDGAQAQAASSGVKATHSPAMDILLSSNFERLLYYLALETTSGATVAAGAVPSEDARAVAQDTLNGWMSALKRDGRVDLGAKVREAGARDFWAERVSDQQTVAEIKRYYGRKYIVDPHTAVGLVAQDRSAKKAPDSTWVTLSTAHPAKFSSAVELAMVGTEGFSFERDVLPPQLKELEGMQKRIVKVQGEQGVRDLIERVSRGEPAHGRDAEGKGSI